MQSGPLPPSTPSRGERAPAPSPVSLGRRLRRAALAACLGAGAAAWVAWPPGLVIESPSFGGPAILTPGSEVAVVARAAVPWGAPVDEIALERGGSRVPLAPPRTVEGGARRIVVAAVPQDCPPGVYDVVARAGGREARAHRAAAVLRNLPERFTLAQITDLHVGATREGEALVESVITELNRLGPALVLATGDLTQDGTWPELTRVTRALDRLTMPVVCVPGNHDRRGWGGFLTTFGLPYKVVRFGRWTMLGLDAGHGRDEFTESQLRFARRALDEAEPGWVIVLVHVPLAGKRSVKAHGGELMELIRNRRVPLVLSGHLHYGVEYGTRADPADGETRFGVSPRTGGTLGRDAGDAAPGFTLVTVEGGRIASLEFHAIASQAARETAQ